MLLEMRFAQDVSELYTATRNGDGETVRGIVLDNSIANHEAIFLVATVCSKPNMDRWLLACQVSAGSEVSPELLASERANLVRSIAQFGDVAGVVRALGQMGRIDGCCMAAMIAEVHEPAAAVIAEQMERLHDDPELLGGLA